MPTYEYRCPDGHTFEIFQKMSEEPSASCPECGQEAERLLSGGAGLLFKGEGFYITDYRSEEYRKKASRDGKKVSSEGGDGAKETGGGESGSESSSVPGAGGGGGGAAGADGSAGASDASGAP